MKRSPFKLTMTVLTLALLLAPALWLSRPAMADSEKIDAESIAEWLLAKKK